MTPVLGTRRSVRKVKRLSWGLATRSSPSSTTFVVVYLYSATMESSWYTTFGAFTRMGLLENSLAILADIALLRGPTEPVAR